MSLLNPSACDDGSFFYYGPSFAAGDWDGDGGGLNYGATISSPASGSTDTTHAYLAIANIAKLHVEMEFDYRDVGSLSIGSALGYCGIGIVGRDYDTTMEPASQTGGNAPKGGWIYPYSFGGVAAFIGRNLSAAFINSTLVSVTTYSQNKLTLDVSVDQGSNTYNITVRMQIPDIGMDQTEVLTINNAGFGPEGFLVLNGPYLHHADNIFSVTKLYVTSPNVNLGNACSMGARDGIAHGFEGFISVFEDDKLDGTTHTLPQALHVDQDDLSFEKEIVVRDRAVGDGRVTNASAVVYKAAKPQGGFTYQFRSEDLLKVAYSHFQLGSVEAGTVAPYRYHFYPKKDPLDWAATGTRAKGTYGEAFGKPYTVSVLKRLHNPGASYEGTNAFFFKHAVCDKLGFSLQIGDDAKAHAKFKFRDLDPGTAVPDVPNSTAVGSYATTPSFMSWAASVSLGGTAIGISSFSLDSDQGVQEFSRVGRQAPENYNFDKYRITGEFSFDLPLDALKEVGSMFGSHTFSFLATLYNGTSDRVVFNLPTCRRMPFDFRAQSGAQSIKSSIPFEAFESAGTYPIRLTVDTNYVFTALTT